MKTLPLKARRRTDKGTDACRRLRRAGEIPINLYGKIARNGESKSENLDLAASAYDIMQLLGKHASILDVSFDGRKEMAVVREVQRDAFGDDVLHLDLVMIDPTKPVELAVDLVLKGEAKGAKGGGRLIVQLRQLMIRAIPAKIPAEIIANPPGGTGSTVLAIPQHAIVRSVRIAHVYWLPAEIETKSPVGAGPQSRPQQRIEPSSRMPQL